MKIQLGNGTTFRPILSCVVVILLCGTFGVFSSIMLGTGALVFTGIRGSSDLTDEVQKIIDEDPQLADIFGSPIKIKTFGSSYTSSYNNDVTTATYEAPISGPIQSGELVARIKKVGDETRVTYLSVYADSGTVINIISE